MCYSFTLMIFGDIRQLFLHLEIGLFLGGVFLLEQGEKTRKGGLEEDDTKERMECFHYKRYENHAL